MSESFTPVSATSDARGAVRAVWLWAGAALWLAGAVAGLWVLWSYENTPGDAANSGRRWPTETRLARSLDRPTLVLLAHPQCTCTRASLAELAEVLGRRGTPPKTYVLFMKPSQFFDGWEKTDLWRTASALPNVTVVRDDDGLEAQRFGAVTSGQTLLYDAGGELIFSGGITGARGHAGDNAGRAALIALLDRKEPSRRATSVFGCSLFSRRVRSPRPGTLSCPLTPPLNARDASTSDRAGQLFAEAWHQIHHRTDRLFAGLMAFQWLMGIAFALWVSPLAWDGPVSRTHLHVWAAIIVGGIISLFPALLGLFRPGLPSTRYVIAVAQMLMGALLIHLTGGRIETHFHVFGSLAFLAFYRDWRVLIPATVVVALDHLLRGIFWPQSVYGVVVASQWRWLEHAAWVLFEDVVSLRRLPPQHRGNAAHRRPDGDARARGSHTAGGGERRAKRAGPQRRHSRRRSGLRHSDRRIRAHRTVQSGRGADIRLHRGRSGRRRPGRVDLPRRPAPAGARGDGQLSRHRRHGHPESASRAHGDPEGRRGVSRRDRDRADLHGRRQDVRRLRPRHHRAQAHRARAGQLHERARGRARHAAEGRRAAGDSRRRAAGRAPARRDGDARQERVPRQHEPRASHAAERHHSVQRAPAGDRGRREDRPGRLAT